MKLATPANVNRPENIEVVENFRVLINQEEIERIIN